MKRWEKSFSLALLCAVLVLGFGCPTVWAEKAIKDVEIDGLIMDQTTTKIGHDFFEYFRSLWEDETTANINIVVNEYKDPRLGIWISVEMNDTLVYRAHLGTKPDDIEAAAKEALEAAKVYIASLPGLLH